MRLRLEAVAMSALSESPCRHCVHPGAVCMCRLEPLEKSRPHTPVELLSTDAVEGRRNAKQPNTSVTAASPVARTPPQAPRVRALKRLVQTKNRCCADCTLIWHHVHVCGDGPNAVTSLPSCDQRRSRCWCLR